MIDALSNRIVGQVIGGNSMGELYVVPMHSILDQIRDYFATEDVTLLESLPTNLTEERANLCLQLEAREAAIKQAEETHSRSLAKLQRDLDAEKKITRQTRGMLRAAETENDSLRTAVLEQVDPLLDERDALHKELAKLRIDFANQTDELNDLQNQVLKASVASSMAQETQVGPPQRKKGDFADFASGRVRLLSSITEPKLPSGYQ